MVVYFGMGEKVANVSYYDVNGQGFTKPYSEKIAEEIDDEVKSIVSKQYERAKQILMENKEGHNQLAELLIEREVIFTEDMERIFGKRPWTSRADELLADSDVSNDNQIEDKSKEENVVGEIESSTEDVLEENEETER